MRYALIIPDGAADRPHPEYGGRTALEAADIPGMHRLAREGRLGLAKSVPDGMKPGSDVANLSLLGYDPADCYTGRAPLEAASLGISLAPGEAVFRANTVCVVDGIMDDYAGGHITTEESHALILELDKKLGIPGVKLHPGVSYRHACVFADMAHAIADRTPPHDITGKPVAGHEPKGELAARLIEVEEKTIALLPDCAVNRQRVKDGKKPITQLWLWGGGVMPSLNKFEDKYGISGGLISAVDLLRGIATLAGLEVIHVVGATGYYDTNYKGKGEAALDCLKRHPFVAIHIEAPDEAGHNGHGKEKVRALGQIDKLIVQPMLEEADRAGDLRILCLPDHPTPLEIRTHSSDPIPFALWGPGIPSGGGKGFTEAAAEKLVQSGKESLVLAPELMSLLTAK